MIDLKKALTLCLVIGTENCATGQLFNTITQAVAAGVTSIQIREKNANDGYVAAIGKQLLKLLPGNILLVINDRIEVAKYLDVAVHIGQTDMSYQQARKVLGKKALIGVSINNVPQAECFRGLDNNYVGIGPVFATSSKPDVTTPIGIESLINIRQILVDKVCVAIGGITLANVTTLKKSGVDGIAVISAICQAQNPYLATKKLLTLWNTT